VARRAGDVWYVGGINGQDAQQDAKVALSFLAPGTWKMTQISDGADDRTFADSLRQVTEKETIQMMMRARGGFVMRLGRP
jgi:alpha-glucosidase